MNKHIIFTLAKKEFFSFFNSPLSFVIIVPFLFISTFIYLRTSMVVGEASMRSYFELLPWFLILLAPALSMKLLTEERSRGTLELLFAHPLSEIDIVLGKFLGALGFFLLILATTISLPLSLLVAANPDPGILLSQYIGGILVGATFLSLGLMVSAYVTSPIGSFLLAAAGSFVLILLGVDFVVLLFPWPASRIVQELAITNHMNNIARGLLDIRDILYFLTLTGLFLTATIMKLSERKIQEDPAEKRKLSLALALIASIGIALNALMIIYPLRLDATQQKLFTLSSGTKQTIQNLPDIVTLTLYASRNLPGPMQLTLKEVQDLLTDYSRFGNRLQISTRYADDPQIAAQARQLGIEEMTFNRMGSDSFEIQTGMLGLAIRYGDKTESLPYLADTSDLEYQITRRIRKLTAPKEQTVGIFKNTFNQFQLMEEMIKTQYAVQELSIDDLGNEAQWKDLSALIVIDDGAAESTASSQLSAIAQKRGRMLFLTDGVNVNTQMLSGTKSKTPFNAFLANYGITVNTDLVYDLELNETLTFGGGQVRYLAPYPYWLRAVPADSGGPVSRGIKSVTLGWPSSLEIAGKDGITQKPLLTTSKNAGKQTDNFTIDPSKLKELPPPSGQTIPLAAAIEQGNTRIIVVADADLASDQMLQNFPENAAFLTNGIDYLAAESDIAAIPRKTAGRAVFRFTNPVEALIFQYGNMIIPPVAVVIFALYWLARRRRATMRKLVVKTL